MKRREGVVSYSLKSIIIITLLKFTELEERDFVVEIELLQAMQQIRNGAREAVSVVFTSGEAEIVISGVGIYITVVYGCVFSFSFLKWAPLTLVRRYGDEVGPHDWINVGIGWQRRDDVVVDRGRGRRDRSRKGWWPSGWGRVWRKLMRKRGPIWMVAEKTLIAF
jgi:hypothetical protein